MVVAMSSKRVLFPTFYLISNVYESRSELCPISCCLSSSFSNSHKARHNFECKINCGQANYGKVQTPNSPNTSLDLHTRYEEHIAITKSQLILKEWMNRNGLSELLNLKYIQSNDKFGVLDLGMSLSLYSLYMKFGLEFVVCVK